MADFPGADAAARAIHRAFAKLVHYTAAGVPPISVLAVRAHGAAGVLMDDQTARQLSFELRKEDVPAKPREGDGVSENNGAGPHWRVIETLDLDDVDAWRVVVASNPVAP